MKDFKVFNLMEVSLTLISVDANHKGIVDYEIDGEKARLENVYISGLVRYLFNNPERKDFVYGKKYTSVNNSQIHSECPIKLIRTCNREGELSFVLKITHEGTSIIKEFYTPNGNVKKQRYFNSLPKGKWMRYADYYEYNLKKFKKSNK